MVATFTDSALVPTAARRRTRRLLASERDRTMRLHKRLMLAHGIVGIDCFSDDRIMRVIYACRHAQTFETALLGLVWTFSHCTGDLSADSADNGTTIHVVEPGRRVGLLVGLLHAFSADSADNASALFAFKPAEANAKRNGFGVNDALRRNSKLGVLHASKTRRDGFSLHTAPWRDSNPADDIAHVRLESMD
jgi:hypothetical protein